MIVTLSEERSILAVLPRETRERVRNMFLIEQAQAGVLEAVKDDAELAAVYEAIREDRIPIVQFRRYMREKGVILPIGGSAAGFYITNAEAVSMLTDHGVGINAGTAAVIEGYDGSVPADADAANGNNKLFTCTCSATAFSGVADDTPGALATFDTITDDSSADATGTLTFFRISTQNGGTVTDQGTAGTSSVDLVMNTASITSGSTVSITAATILLPEGP